MQQGIELEMPGDHFFVMDRITGQKSEAVEIAEDYYAPHPLGLRKVPKGSVIVAVLSYALDHEPFFEAMIYRPVAKELVAFRRRYLELS